MGFKFDDDDDELSLDIGGDTAKTQKPAPLPPKVKAEEETEKPSSRPSIPVKPANVTPTADVLKDLPRPGKTVSDPKEKDDELSSLLEEPVKPKITPPAPAPRVVLDETPIIEEPVVEEPVSTLNVQPISSTPTSRRYSASALEEPLNLESQSILSREETSSTLVKSGGKPFSGARRKVMQIRIIAGAVASFLIFSGVYSFLPKPGFDSDVNSQSLAVTNSNKYESIKQASEAHALKLMTDLLNRPNYTSEMTLKDRLSTYIPQAQTTSILTSFALNTYQISGVKDRSVGYFYQTVINGPVVENQEVISAAKIERVDLDKNGSLESYVYPIKISAYITYSTDPIEKAGAKLNPLPMMGSKWVYYTVPVVYNYEKKTAYLYGYPAVTGAPSTEDYADYNDILSEPIWEIGDEELNASAGFKEQVKTFITLWVAQEPKTNLAGLEISLKNMLSKETDPLSPLYPTIRIAQGLNGAYELDPEASIIYDVEGLPEDTEATPETLRRLMVTVTLADNTTEDVDGITRPTIKQQYIISFVENANTWFFIDIKPRFTE